MAGKSKRKGLSLIQISRMFPDDATAEAWFVARRWPQGPFCPYCGSLNVQCGIKHKTMTHRCRDCPSRPMFSLKTGSIMEGTKLGYRVWAMAYFLLATNLKSVSSMKLHRDLGIGQKTAWHLAHRIRQSWAETGAPDMAGPVEVDETYMGGKRKNMSRADRKGWNGLGRGAVGKTPVAGAVDRDTNTVRARVVGKANGPALHGFVASTAAPGAAVYTDDARMYRGIPFAHETVNHSAGEYVRGAVHTQGIESFWSMLKRAHKGTFHKMSAKHMQRYVDEFAGRHNMRPLDTIDQMARMVAGSVGKRLRWRDLVA